MSEEGRLTDRKVSVSGDWSGNVFDFYSYVKDRIAAGLEEQKAVVAALQETLQNCLVNADYRGVGGVVIVKSRDRISVSNPGGFRINLADAKNGGVSDPRNAALARMFHLLNIGDGSGDGILNMFCTENGKRTLIPEITESFAPERITVIFDLTGKKKNMRRKKAGAKVKAVKVSGRSLAMKQLEKERIIEYLTYHVCGGVTELAEALSVKPQRMKQCLAELTAEGIVMKEEADVYGLKA